MQHVDNHMDDLLRSAAERYPLKTDNRQWGVIASQLTGGINAQEVREKKRRKKRWFFLILFASFISTGNILLWYPHYNKKGVARVENRLEERMAKNTPPGLLMMPEKLPAKPVSNGTASKRSLSKAVFIPDYYKRSSRLNPGLFDDHEDTEMDVINKSPITLRPIKFAGAPTVNISMPVKNKPGAIVSTPSQASKNNQPKKGFYVALTTGPDFSRVNTRSRLQPGFFAGALVGYQFPGRLSLETGLLAGEKNYVCSGSYFSMKEIGSSMPSGMVLNTIKGNIHFVEIPLALNYQIIQNRHHSFGVSAGVSAYIVTKETNNYDATNNGINEKMKGQYKKNRSYLPAAASLAINYQHQIGKNLQFRAAPYLKLPVNKIGIGSLPLSSTGISVSLLKPLY